MAATRRQFLQASASAAAALSLDPTAFAQPAVRPNVLLLVVDTLRADHVSAYGGRAQTPNIDELARQRLRFTRFHPEAMATVPARRSILTGRRVWPFSGWHPWPDMVEAPAGSRSTTPTPPSPAHSRGPATGRPTSPTTPSAALPRRIAASEGASTASSGSGASSAGRRL